MLRSLSLQFIPRAHPSIFHLFRQFQAKVAGSRTHVRFIYSFTVVSPRETSVGADSGSAAGVPASQPDYE